MSLVAYDNSDDSDEEIVKENENDNLCCNFSVELKKNRETVKIKIPSLDKFKDEETEEVPPKKLKFQGGSGLFSILPPPKNSSDSITGFTPYILTKKKGPTEQMKKIQSDPTGKDSSSSSLKPHHIDLNEHDVNDDTSNNDFFSLENVTKTENTVQKCSYEELSNTTSAPDINIAEQNHSSDFTAAFLKPTNSEDKVHFDGLSFGINDCNTTTLGPDDSSNNAPGTNIQESLLKDEAFLKLQGRRREIESVDIIDVSADDQLTNKNEWLMKSLTEERDQRPSKRKSNLPTQQQKRKHQITYLAFQAKERELDLKNQWSQNSRTRRETQAKYGF